MVNIYSLNPGLLIQSWRYLSETKHLCLRRPAHSWTPTIPKMKKTKKQSNKTLPSMGRVSNSSITRILEVKCLYWFWREQVVVYLMLGILLIAFRGLNTLTVLIADKWGFSTSIRYSRALLSYCSLEWIQEQMNLFYPETTMKQSSLFQVSCR